MTRRAEQPQVPYVGVALEVSVAIGEADPVDNESGEAGGGLVALEAAQSEVGHRADRRGPELIGQGAHVAGAGGDVFGRPAGYPVEQFEADQFRQASQAEHPAGERLGARAAHAWNRPPAGRP